MCIGFWWKNLRERDHLEDPDVDGRIILSLVFRKWNGGGGHGLDWSHGRDRWLALVCAVMNRRLP